MRDTCIITRTFRHHNREAFDISLIDFDFGPGNSHMYLIKSVTLPFQLTNKFYDLLDENKIPENDSYNYEYCNELLEIIAEFIIEENKIYSPFFYPVDFLNSSRGITDDFIEKYDTTKKEIRQCKYQFFDQTSFKVLFFINLMKLMKAMGKNFHLQNKTIRRVEFELLISDFETGVAYTEIYNNVVSFSLLYSKKTKLPVCTIAYCQKKQIKFGIITGNESISI